MGATAAVRRFSLIVLIVAGCLAAREAYAELTLSRAASPLCRFSGETHSVTTTFANPRGEVAKGGLRGRVYQTGTSTAVPVADLPDKAIEVPPSATLDVVWSVTLPAVRAKTRFVIRWTTADGKAAGATELWAFPRGILSPLRRVLSDGPLGLLDVGGSVGPVLEAEGVALHRLTESDEAKFAGPIALIVVDGAPPTEATMTFAGQLAQNGTTLVWVYDRTPAASVQPPPHGQSIVQAIPALSSVDSDPCVQDQLLAALLIARKRNPPAPR